MHKITPAIMLVILLAISSAGCLFNAPPSDVGQSATHEGISAQSQITTAATPSGAFSANTYSTVIPATVETPIQTPTADPTIIATATPVSTPTKDTAKISRAQVEYDSAVRNLAQEKAKISQIMADADVHNMTGDAGSLSYQATVLRFKVEKQQKVVDAAQADVDAKYAALQAAKA